MPTADHDYQFNCPRCQLPLLVGNHSLKIDEARIAQERTNRIESAATRLAHALEDPEWWPGHPAAAALQELCTALRLPRNARDIVTPKEKP